MPSVVHGQSSTQHLTPPLCFAPSPPKRHCTGHYFYCTVPDQAKGINRLHNTVPNPPLRLWDTSMWYTVRDQPLRNTPRYYTVPPSPSWIEQNLHLLLRVCYHVHLCSRYCALLAPVSYE